MFAKEIQSIDFLVLEGIDHATIPQGSAGMLAQPYWPIAQEIIKSKPTLPIYCVDSRIVRPWLGFLEEFSPLLLGVPASILFGYRAGLLICVTYALFAMMELAFTLPLALGETKVCPKLIDFCGLIHPTEVNEPRNAIAARKIEEVLVPTVKHRPKVAIVYGAGHCGIEGNLKFKRRRDCIISLFKTLHYPAMDKSTIDAITRTDYDNQTGLWNFKRFNAGCIQC